MAQENKNWLKKNQICSNLRKVRLSLYTATPYITRTSLGSQIFFQYNVCENVSRWSPYTQCKLWKSYSLCISYSMSRSPTGVWHYWKIEYRAFVKLVLIKHSSYTSAVSLWYTLHFRQTFKYLTSYDGTNFFIGWSETPFNFNFPRLTFSYSSMFIYQLYFR